MSEKPKPSVILFEKAVKSKDYELACRELLTILNKLDSNFGRLDGIECDFPSALSGLEKEQRIHFCTRMAVAVTILFEDPKLSISRDGAKRFFVLQRWLALIFASSPYVNADHILRTYDLNTESEGSSIRLPSTETALIKFCILYFPDSYISINLNVIWELSPWVCASLCFALQSPRFIGTPVAFMKRNKVLQWFPERLATFQNFNDLPINIGHDLYMHCSYDVAENKHIIKKSLNKVIRSHLLELGWQDRNINHIGYKNGKPIMVVLLEHFHSSHSIYRTHSTSMKAAREQFYLVGFGKEAVDEAGRSVFDEFHLLIDGFILDRLNQIKEFCDKSGASVFYMPSIGMDLVTIFASNTRLAPIQVIALGHPATTHSDFIEYVIVEDDYVGSEECFSETLLRLPKDALPYVPSAAAPAKIEYRFRENPEVVNIGVASTTMKLNPHFLEACKAIRDRAKVKVHFHFALGQSNGITHPYVERFIKSYLGDSATAHAHSPYDKYLQILSNCDMMVNPFPFGNTNGIIDMVTLGLVGICKTGPEVHEHIDEGLFKRLGLPDWLVAHTADEYVERAIRLAENHEERLALRRHIIENNGLQTLFTGNPKPMGQVLMNKVVEWADNNNVVLTSENNATVVEPKVAKVHKPKKEVKVVVKKAEDKNAKKSPAKSKAKEKKVSPLKEVAKKLKKTN